MAKKVTRVEMTAEVIDARAKAVRLQLTIDGENKTLWFRRIDAECVEGNVWSIKETALAKALKEAADFEAYHQETVNVAAGSFGVCKNGSYWFKTRGWNYSVERGVRSELAFINADNVTINADGTATVKLWAANKALSDAAYRTPNCDSCEFSGLIAG